MARLPRLALPGISQPVVQLANNRLPFVLDDGDRARHRQLLGEALRRTGCALHAWALMDNHVHLLLAPPAAGAVARLMQALGRRDVALFNARHGRTGTLWEGRYKVCLVDSATYVLRCYRYIDLNPVRSRMIEDPTAYPWSSCAANTCARADPMLTPHPNYLALAPTAERRATAYQALLADALPDDQVTEIRAHLQQQRAPGRDNFPAMVEARTARFAGIRPAHRPRRQPKFPA